MNLTSVSSREPEGDLGATFRTYDNLQRAARLFLEAARLTLQGERDAVQDCSKRAIDLVCRQFGSLWSTRVQHDLLARPDDTLPDARCRRVLLHIESNLSNPLRIDYMAAELGFSATHFNNWFKARFGVAPKAYVRARRIELAKSLMLGTTMPLSEIALSCGMADQAHFTRIFRRSVGETPAKWRSEWAQPV